jgi:hypothetical protein
LGFAGVGSAGDLERNQEYVCMAGGTLSKGPTVMWEVKEDVEEVGAMF